MKGNRFVRLSEATVFDDAGRRWHRVPESGSRTHNFLSPVPARGIGFQAGRSPEETLLVVRLSGFDMAFQIQSSGLASLADELGRIARTLSAGLGKPQ